MKILFLCGREASYPFNRLLIKLMRRFSQLTVPHEQGKGKSIVKRSVLVLTSAFPEIVSGKYDLIFVGFYGHFLVPAVRAMTRTPILFNPFISTYDTLVFDRKKASPLSVAGRLAYKLDRIACRSADHLLLDTAAHVNYFCRMFDLPKERFSVMPVGSDETLFFPRQMKAGGETKMALYFGNYLPLHGVDVIIHAAARLKNRSDIRLKMLGEGIEYARIRGMANDMGIKNLIFSPAVPFDTLANEIADADVCLGGHFGVSEKAARVIAGKTYHSMAMGKATIVGDNEANREMFTHQHDAWFVRPDDERDLAASIELLIDDNELREKIGFNARQTFMKRASLEVLENQLKKVIEKTLDARRS